MERKWTGDAKRMSKVDQARIERLRRAGETFVVIAETVGCSEKSIQRYLRATGGLQSRSKERSARYLSLADREELSRGLIAGESMRAIAVRLERAPSTISREIALNGGGDLYRAWKADNLALERELTRYVRTGRTQRRPRMRTEYSGGGRLQNMVMISERPAEVEDRAVPRSLGGGPHHWSGRTLGHRDSGRACEPLLDAFPPSQRTHGGRCSHRVDPDGRQASRGNAPHSHLGPGQGDGGSHSLQHGQQHGGLLLRSSQSLATRQQRKHEPAPPTVFSERDRPEPVQRRSLERGRPAAERPSSRDVRLAETSGGLCSKCCDDRLKKSGVGQTLRYGDIDSITCRLERSL